MILLNERAPHEGPKSRALLEEEEEEEGTLREVGAKHGPVSGKCP